MVLLLLLYNGRLYPNLFRRPSRGGGDPEYDGVQLFVFPIHKSFHLKSTLKEVCRHCRAIGLSLYPLQLYDYALVVTGLG